MKQLKCAVCDAEFESKSNKKTCSKECLSKLRSSNRITQNTKQCELCEGKLALEKKCNELEKENESLKQQVTSAETMQAQLGNKNVVLEEESYKYKNEIIALNDKNVVLKNVIEELNNTKTRLKTELDDAKNKIEKLELDNKLSYNKNQDLSIKHKRFCIDLTTNSTFIQRLKYLFNPKEFVENIVKNIENNIK